MRSISSLLAVQLLLVQASVAFAASANIPSGASVVRGGGSITQDNGSVVVPLKEAKHKFYTVASNAENGGSITVGDFYSFAKWSGTGAAQWSVPSGSIATCYDMNMVLGGNVAIQFGYATATFTDSTASASPPTGAACFSNVACGTSSIAGSRLFQSSATYAKVALVFDASSTGANATIYPFWRGNAVVAVQMDLLCYEQTP